MAVIRKRPKKIYIGLRLEAPLVREIDVRAKQRGISRAEEIRQRLRDCREVT